MAESPALEIKQGATYSFGFVWHRDLEDDEGNVVLDPETGLPLPGVPYDLSGCSARMQIRRKKGEPVLVQATSEAAFVDGQRDEEAIARGAGRIVLQGGDDSIPGHVRVTLTDLDTQALAVKAAVYDLEIEWPLEQGEIRPRVDRPLQGNVTVSLNITEET